MSAFDSMEDEGGEVSVALPRSAADRQKLKTMISEATYCLQRVDDEKAAIKDIIEVVHTDFQLSKKHTRRLINTLYKQNYTDRVAEEEEFEFLYEGLFKVAKLTAEDEDEIKAFLASETADLPFDTND